MADLTAVVLRFVRLYGPIALTIFTFLETSMLFPFLPSEVVVPAAAALLVHDVPSFLVFVITAGVGGTIGAFVPFYVFRGSRLGGVDRLRSRIQVSDERIERGRNWFRRWGSSSVLWGRFLPVIRSVVSIPAGLVRMTPTRFGIYTAAGTVGFYATVGAIVYYGRQQSLVEAASGVAADRPWLTVTVLVCALVFGLVVRTWYDRRSHQ